MIKKYSMAIIALLLAALLSPVVAADVLLGAGDVLKITVYDHPDLTLETRVSEAGGISYPLVGQVTVGGISSAVAEKKIASLLESGKFIRNAQVNIIVTVMQSQQVSILGQVNRPGRYPIDGRRSILEVLALAGGVNSEAGDTATLVRHRDGNSNKQVIDIMSMVESGDLALNSEVLAGDIVYVARAKRFYIYGQVQRPGVYRLERGMTVLQALSVGGGLSPRGTERGIRIKRSDLNGAMQEMTAKHDDLINMDDVLYVQESLF